MLIEQTLEKMNVMKLTGMTEALRQQLGSAQHTKLGFDERLGLLVDAEWLAREQKRLTTRLHAAKLRYPASLEDVDFKHPRGLDRQVVLSLANCGFVSSRHNLVITGPTGIGKSYLACAFVERACRCGHKAGYLRLPRLLQQLAVARGDGSYARILDRLQRFELLAIDDWLLAPLRDPERRDLVEVIEDRSERASTLVASQLPVKDWHASIDDPNLADAICDRVLNNAHRIELKGPSMRRTTGNPKSTSETRA
ncbi:MAG: ATP-binding protein [Acidobacteria bacterium]|nr:ATP-binding protein [Acidobacteriota bacterium]